MEIKHFVLSMFYSNCYVVSEENKAFIVDMGENPKQVEEYIKENNLDVQFILLTHGHVDHAGGVDEFKKHFDVPVYLHKNDRMNIDNKEMWFAKMDSDSINVDENTEINFNAKKIKVIETPGHTTGGVCYLIDDVLFTGDTLFRLSIGRTDFKDGDLNALLSGIRNKLFTLPDETKVLPGHNSASTIMTEKKYNSFLK